MPTGPYVRMRRCQHHRNHVQKPFSADSHTYWHEASSTSRTTGFAETRKQKSSSFNHWRHTSDIGPHGAQGRKEVEVSPCHKLKLDVQVALATY